MSWAAGRQVPIRAPPAQNAAARRAHVRGGGGGELRGLPHAQRGRIGRSRPTTPAERTTNLLHPHARARSAPRAPYPARSPQHPAPRATAVASACSLGASALRFDRAAYYRLGRGRARQLPRRDDGPSLPRRHARARSGRARAAYVAAQDVVAGAWRIAAIRRRHGRRHAATSCHRRAKHNLSYVLQKRSPMRFNEFG